MAELERAVNLVIGFLSAAFAVRVVFDHLSTRRRQHRFAALGARLAAARR